MKRTHEHEMAPSDQRVRYAHAGKNNETETIFDLSLSMRRLHFSEEL